MNRKIAQILKLAFLLNLLITFYLSPVSAADSLQVIRTVKAYHQSVKMDKDQKMVDLRKLVPTIVLDLRYATTNNFMGRVMYPPPVNHTYLRAPAAKALAAVQEELKQKGLGLKIFDAYRPYSVTEKFWELVHDDRYVADPKKGSGHNRGIAVDLTIIELASGKEIAMPTGFDNFTDSAHQDFMQLSQEVLQNRKLLRETMEKHGFKYFETEWWHFSLPDAAKYDVMDLTFNELDHLN